MNNPVLQIPVIPNAIFYALRRGLARTPLAGYWHVENGDTVAEYQKIVTFGSWSERLSLFKSQEHVIDIVSPVSGKVFYRDYIEYDYWDEKELWPKNTGGDNSLFVIQTTNDIDGKIAMSKAYESLFRYISALMGGTKGSGFSNRDDIEQYREAVLNELKWMKAAKARKIEFDEWKK